MFRLQANQICVRVSATNFLPTNKLLTLTPAVPGTPALYRRRSSLSVERCVHLLLMQTEHFLLMQLHIKSCSVVKRGQTCLLK